jgi:hypothetical protein
LGKKVFCLLPSAQQHNQDNIDVESFVVCNFGYPYWKPFMSSKAAHSGEYGNCTVEVEACSEY